MLRNVTHQAVRPRIPRAIYCSPESGKPERAALVSRNVIGLVALYLVLRIVFGSVMGMTLVVEVAGMNLDDRPRHPPRLGIPAHVLADIESLGHLTNFSLKGVDTITLGRLLELWVEHDRGHIQESGDGYTL